MKGVQNKINSGLPKEAETRDEPRERQSEPQPQPEQTELEKAGKENKVSLPEEVDEGEEPNKVEETSVGGMKNINKNINKELKKITKKLNKFYNRKHKPNMTRRQRKQ